MATEEERFLRLFDTYWFEISILSDISPSETQSTTNSSLEIQEEIQEQNFSPLATLKVRYLSEQQVLNSTSSFSSNSLSPNTVLALTKLQPILCGKEITEFSQDRVEEEDLVQVPKKTKLRERKRGNSSKSLSDLEFEELKGFMDLGFVFSEEADEDTELVSIIPGLQRQRNKDGEEDKSEVICRPYLSEAWDVLDQRKKEEPILMDWKVRGLGNEMNMKEQLRYWAHTVASTVRRHNRGKTFIQPCERIYCVS